MKRMLRFIKNFMFPRIPSRPLTEKVREEKRKEFAKRFVSAHAEGNIALARGHFTLK